MNTTCNTTTPEARKSQPDFRHLSYNEMVDLIVNLYKEIDRLTAERKASDDALNRLAGNVNVSSYSISQIKDAVAKTVSDTIISLRKVRKPVVKKKSKK